MKVSGIVLSLLIAGCGSTNVDLIKAQNNAGNKPNIESENRQTKPMIKIQQGTVGKVGEFSVGVSNLNDSSAKFSIWNRALPQVERNDYLITMTARTGEVVPIGKDFYRIGKITENAVDQSQETVEIESEPVKIGGGSFSSDVLALPVAGILELHDTSVELISTKTEGGKTVAEVETYSNNYPKETLAQQGEIKKTVFAAGDEITIGNKKHKVAAVRLAKENVRGILEIAILPTN